jgi:hypothetical protein
VDGGEFLMDATNLATRPLNAHVWEREADEHYVEPEWCSERLFAVEEFVGAVWDPACGFGRIPRAAAKAGLPTHASDLMDRGYGYQCDFLKSGTQQPNIVTNPPFNIAREFALRALKLASRKVAIIFPTARLNAARWLDETPLVQVWLLTPRPSMPPGHIIAAGAKAQGGKMDFCWLVFDRRHPDGGRREIGWLRRDVSKGA